VTGTASGINSLQELIARAKAKPGSMNYATPGIGSLHHLVLASLAASAGFEAKHILYKGAGDGRVHPA